MRYAYVTTAALLLAGTGLALTANQPVGAQTAQNEGLRGSAPRGAPQSFADMVTKLQPAVVNISVNLRVSRGGASPLAGTPFEGMLDEEDGGGRPQTQRRSSAGSGFIISADGYVVTNHHVVTSENASAKIDKITIVMQDRTEYVAKVVGTDKFSDLALLKIEAPKPLPFVKFGDSSKARVGDWVVAIGNPFDIGSTVSAGIISALHRNTRLSPDANSFIQTDASINQGNSGGPMFDMNGNVIGINSQIMSPTGANIGIGFAIPSEQARPVIDTLRAGGAVKRGYLGIGPNGGLSEDMADALGLDKNRGDFVNSVVAGGPAEKAGLKPGDVVLRVAGKAVTPSENLSYIIADQPVGSRIPIEVVRDGKPMTLSAIVGERPSEDKLDAIRQPTRPNPDRFGSQSRPGDQKGASSQALGIAAVPLTPEIAKDVGVPSTLQGLVVSAVDSSTDAGQKGLQRGDVILTAGPNNAPVKSQEDLDKIAGEVKKAGRSTVMLQVQRKDDTPIFLAIRMRDL